MAFAHEFVGYYTQKTVLQLKHFNLLPFECTFCKLDTRDLAKSHQGNGIAVGRARNSMAYAHEFVGLLSQKTVLQLKHSNLLPFEFPLCKLDTRDLAKLLGTSTLSLTRK